MIVADVGVIDVSVYGIGDRVAINSMTQFVGSIYNGFKIVTVRLKQAHDL